MVAKPIITAFSERQPEIIKNASFSQEIGIFRLFFLQTEGRSFVENDRSPSFDDASRHQSTGADVWALCVRFLGLVLRYGGFA